MGPRRQLPLLVALCVLACCAALPSMATGMVQLRQPETLDLTILHDNDLHGHLFPFTYAEAGRSSHEEASRGGAARRSELVRQLRREIRNPVILIDSGDIATRGPLWSSYEGEADVAAMNSIGYDLATIGNNEFKLKDGVEQNDAEGSQAALRRIIHLSRFPWICANAFISAPSPTTASGSPSERSHSDAGSQETPESTEEGSLLEGVQPFVVRTMGGVRVGFLGLTAPRSASYPQTLGWSIIDPIQAAREWIPRARKECDVLIAVTHIGVDLDRALAAQTTGLDAIIGGDSHTFLYSAIEATNGDGHKVPIVQAGEFGVDLGLLDLHLRDVNGHWVLTSYHYRLIPIGPWIQSDRTVDALLAPYLHPLQRVVGHLPGVPPAERQRQTDQVIADSLRDATGADIAVASARSGFDVFHSSTVTVYDIYSVMPFKDAIVTSAMTGGRLQTLLSANRGAVTSGISAALQPDHIYRVALVDFTATDLYKLHGSEITPTGILVQDAIIQLLSRS